MSTTSWRGVARRHSLKLAGAAAGAPPVTLLIVPGHDRVLVDRDGEAPHDAAAAAVEAAVAGLVAALA